MSTITAPFDGNYLEFPIDTNFCRGLLVSHDYCAPSNALFLRQGACIQWIFIGCTAFKNWSFFNNRRSILLYKYLSSKVFPCT
jgi:hypothetical protein